VWSPGSSVGIAMGYGLDGLCSIPGNARFFSSPQRLGPIESPIQWVPGALSPGIKRLGCEVDHSPPTSAEVKKTWIYIYNHPPYVFMA
jgi:hypothetical protein